MSNLNLTFAFDSSAVRVCGTTENPWFVAIDVCKALSLVNVTRSLAKLDDDEKGLQTLKTLGGEQEVNVVNEAGLYSLVLRSYKPEAKQFKRWVTHEVLPSIRKTGTYQLEQYRKLKEAEMAQLVWDLERRSEDIVTLYREKLFGSEEGFREARWVYRLHTTFSKPSFTSTGALINWSASKVSSRVKRYQHYLDATRSERFLLVEQFYEDRCKGFVLEMDLRWKYKTEAEFKHALLTRDPFLEKLGNALPLPDWGHDYNKLFDITELEARYGNN